MTRFAQQKGATPAQIASGLASRKEAVDNPRSPAQPSSRGSKKISLLRPIELTTEDVHTLEAASSAIKVEGERYPATPRKADRSLAGC